MCKKDWRQGSVLSGDFSGVLMEGDGWVAVAKPPGVLVHSHPRFPTERPMLQRVRDHFGRRVWPVHRLDRQASGCLIFAFESGLVKPLAEGLACGEKTYLSLVRGFFLPTEPVTVETPIKESGKLYPSRSVVQLIARCRDPRCSLLWVRPETGRRHQVRRHVRDLNHPILHDGDHGDSRVNRWWREERGLSRLALHALAISFHDQHGIHHQIHCPIFEDHLKVFRQLPLWSESLNQEPLLSMPPLPVQLWD